MLPIMMLPVHLLLLKQVPAGTSLGPATLTATNAAGIAATTRVAVTAADPGIFPGAVVFAGTAVRTIVEFHC